MIALSAFITMLILAVLSYFFIDRVMPRYRISPDTLYFLLVRLLPITIGIVMVLIALVIAPPKVPHDTDEQDMIEKDAYSAPLYNLPVEEEPLLPSGMKAPASFPRPERVAMDAEGTGTPAVPVEIKEFSPKSAPSFAMAQRELPEELKPPVTDVFEESPTLQETETVETESPAALPGEAALPAGNLARAVLFEEYPYPIQEGSEIARLLEPIAESDADEELPADFAMCIEDRFELRLETEIGEARHLGYDLSVAQLGIPSGEGDVHSVDATVVQTLFNKLGIVSFFYLTDTREVSAILPFHGFSQTRRTFASLLESLRKQHPDASVTVGFTSIGSREVTTDRLLEEVRIAAEVAAERGGYSVIGYDTSLEEDGEA
jgi:hypothetical protein